MSFFASDGVEISDEGNFQRGRLRSPSSPTSRIPATRRDLSTPDRAEIDHASLPFQSRPKRPARRCLGAQYKTAPAFRPLQGENLKRWRIQPAQGTLPRQRSRFRGHEEDHRRLFKLTRQPRQFPSRGSEQKAKFQFTEI